jgi:DNA-binding PadR family transcriptional regulator
MGLIGPFEMLCLLALRRAGPDAYGVSVFEKLREHIKREPPLPQVYLCLSRMEKRGLVRSWMGKPEPRRGGRRKKHYEILAVGERALTDALEAQDQLRPDRANIMTLPPQEVLA